MAELFGSGTIEPVLNVHAEEAAFLWLLRDSAVGQPHFSLADLAKLDGRVEAHIDGLRIAADAGWEVCKKELEKGEPGEVFAASVLALESDQPTRIQAVLQIALGNPETARGLISALGWLPYPQVKKHIESLLAEDLPLLRRFGIAASAVHRQHLGPALDDALCASDPLLKARACRAVGELGLALFSPTVQQLLAAQDAGCRFWAAWTCTLLERSADAIDILISLADSPTPLGARALNLVLRVMDAARAAVWLGNLSQSPDTQRLAVIGTGVLGIPERIPWLLEQMKTPALARVAGEAFSTITGADLAYEDLDARKPEGFEAGPTENPADENVAMDPDENLPWPDTEAIRNWWTERKGAFSSRTRCLLGKPITTEWLSEVLRSGRQRQRAAAALELALLQPGKPLFEVRAPGFRQQQLLQDRAVGRA